MEVRPAPKKQRSRNFTEFEKNFVFHLVKQRFANIVDDKLTDAVTLAKKKCAWDRITRIFNSRAQTGPRNQKQIRALYDTLKKLAKGNKGFPVVENDPTAVIKMEDTDDFPEFADNSSSVRESAAGSEKSEISALQVSVSGPASVVSSVSEHDHEDMSQQNDTQNKDFTALVIELEGKIKQKQLELLQQQFLHNERIFSLEIAIKQKELQMKQFQVDKL